MKKFSKGADKILNPSDTHFKGADNKNTRLLESGGKRGGGGGVDWNVVCPMVCPELPNEFSLPSGES